MYRLNIHDVQRRIHEKNEKKIQCYEKILAFCNKRILSNVDREKAKCFFEFPEYVVGFPLFDMNACMEYCKRNLISSGFLVQYHFPNKFYISWDINEIKEYKTQQRKQTPLSALTAPIANDSKDVSLHKPQLPSLTKQPQTKQPPPTQFGSTLLTDLRENNTEKPQQLPIMQQPQPPIPKALTHVPNDLLHKITKPLPITPLTYDPNDVFNTRFDGKPSVLENTFFPNNLKHMLVSDIGSGGRTVNQKSSGKLSLNI
jgi:hypothetical protein